MKDCCKPVTPKTAFTRVTDKLVLVLLGLLLLAAIVSVAADRPDTGADELHDPVTNGK